MSDTEYLIPVQTGILAPVKAPVVHLVLACAPRRVDGGTLGGGDAAAGEDVPARIRRIESQLCFTDDR